MSINIIRIIFIFLIIFVLYNQYKIMYDPIVPTRHILFTRYKELDMSIILEPYINQKNTKVFIYNKGDDLPIGIPTTARNIKIINMENIGWDSYAYLSHVIKNYNDLPDFIYSLHASAQYTDWKKFVYDNILSKDNSVYFYGGEVFNDTLDFQLDNWSASHDLNRKYSPTNEYVISSIRPLGKWLATKVNIIYPSTDNIIHCNYGGMFKVHKSRILRYPLDFYENLLKEISVWQSEVNHYLERSWFTLYN